MKLIDSLLALVPTVAEPPKITQLQRRLSSTRHLEPRKQATAGAIHRAHPKGELERSTFSQGSNNENELQCLIHFIHLEFLEIHYYIAKYQSAEY